MDGVYRYQRYVYDLTRKYYLFGRDRVINEMPLAAGDRVLEMGCGTARNLILLARRHPQAHFYGIDASREMLKTAEQKVKRAGMAERITLRHAFAERVDSRETFGLEAPFDAILYSYSLSMIPPWREAIICGLANLKPGGAVYIVDFWDQGDLPGWFRVLLKRWLAIFHVRHEPEMMNFLDTLKKQGEIENDFVIHSIFGRYAFKTALRKISPERPGQGT